LRENASTLAPDIPQSRSFDELFETLTLIQTRKVAPDRSCCLAKTSGVGSSMLKNFQAVLASKPHKRILFLVQDGRSEQLVAEV
jgi:hypothetical protein